ncbi:MFS transporter [Henriciella mobilis]|uniref:MFS transporter n=1 Tax=Henriciella mobilis TaxID=2305467 RepID=UPI000E66916E|nr:MFS transporter [Henriciella mobilis]RIJ16856.1 MFS transporter [Henriciella mobilis]RIJ19363.1 MFS transporter [Henriciella mobilis]
MSDQPVEILARERMGRAQIVVIVLCVLLNGLDGFDVLSISFAAPGIAEEWGISRGALGLVLSMELIGMSVGSIILGQAADRIGRRPIIITSLCVMTLGMFLAATANSVPVMSGYRLFTGLGIGGMLACTNAMVAEYSNDRYRSLNVTIMATGYPLGAIIGGVIASQLLAHFDWRAVFIFGGVMTALMLPAVLVAMPESVSSLAARRPAGALEKINRTLKRLGHSALERLPDLKESAAASGGGGLRRLLGPALIAVTLLLTLAYFAHIMTFYYILKWIPKLVVDMGYVPSEAGNVLVWANVGGATGGIVLGLLSRKLDIRWLTISVLALAFVFVTYFGAGHDTLRALSVVSAMVGFFTNAGVVGLYALIAKYFPADVRAGGTGFVIGIGRGGAALGPIIAGYLFESGQGLQTVSIYMASGAVIAMIALILLGRRSKALAAA